MRANGYGLVHYMGECKGCGKTWYSKNVLAVAARHAEKCGPIFVGYAYRWDGPGGPADPVVKKAVTP